MMEALSPTKRRALAMLDTNALASPKSLFGKDAAAAAKNLGGPLGSPVKLAAEPRKRAFEVDAETSPKGKKACLGRDEDASSRGHSPDSSSLFDTSANDNDNDNDASWTTAATEPDATTAAAAVAAAVAAAAAAAAPMAAAALERMPLTRPRALTREQAREKIEILRVRLSLANYKVRTGQTNVPLADLQRKPMPRPVPSVRVQSPDDEEGEKKEEKKNSEDENDEDEDELPPPPSTGEAQEQEEEEQQQQQKEGQEQEQDLPSGGKQEAEHQPSDDSQATEIDEEHLAQQVLADAEEERRLQQQEQEEQQEQLRLHLRLQQEQEQQDGHDQDQEDEEQRHLLHHRHMDMDMDMDDIIPASPENDDTISLKSHVSDTPPPAPCAAQ